jgi:hypothetical protein
MTATKTIQKLSVKSGNHEQNCLSDKQADEKLPVTVFHEAVPRFESSRGIFSPT